MRCHSIILYKFVNNIFKAALPDSRRAVKGEMGFGIIISMLVGAPVYVVFVVEDDPTQMISSSLLDSRYA